jgi:hypothetical protein
MSDTLTRDSRAGQCHTTGVLPIAEFSDRLLCVRYRYDWQRRKRLKTVELIVDEADWVPPMPGYVLVGIRVEYEEENLRLKVKAADGRWHSDEKLWEPTYDVAAALGLKKRIVKSLWM